MFIKQKLLNKNESNQETCTEKSKIKYNAVYKRKEKGSTGFGTSTFWARLTPGFSVPRWSLHLVSWEPWEPSEDRSTPSSRGIKHQVALARVKRAGKKRAPFYTAPRRNLPKRRSGGSG